MEILLSMKDIAEGWKRTSYIEKQGQQEDNCSSLQGKLLELLKLPYKKNMVKLSGQSHLQSHFNFPIC